MSSTAAPQTAPQPDVEPIVAAAAVPSAEDTEPEVEAAPSGAPMADTAGRPYRRWTALAVLEGVWTGDDRIMDAESLTWRDLPQALMAQLETAWGHDGAQLVGRIDSAERVDASEMIDARTGEPHGEGAWAIMMSGVFDNDTVAAAVAEKVAGGFLRGVSVDLSDVEYVDELTDADGNPVSIDDIDSGRVDPINIRMRTRVTAGRIMGLTATSFPAFEGAYIQLLDDDGNAGPAMAPGQPDSEQAATAIRASAAPPNPRRCLPCESGGLTAAAAPIEPPSAWFDNPGLVEPTPITVGDDGRVFGHLALWNTCHIGFSGRCVTPPRSATGYSLFNRKPIPTADGSPVQVGPLTVGIGHADTKPSTGMLEVISHYDNTDHVAADVTAGEDELGIWIAGALRPSATAEQIRTLRASSISGDWRPWGEGLELGAILAVNTPGFPVLKQVVASGRPTALIASGPAPTVVLDEVRALLPTLTAAARRELRTQEAETAARSRRAESLRSRRLSLRRTALRARLDTLRSKETR